jgi:uncharacterized protein (DUF1778 family)
MSIATEQKIRREIEMTADQKEMIEYAASLQGLTLEKFIITTLEVVAENVIRGAQAPLKPLSPRAYEQLLDALENPVEPSDELKERYRRYLKRLGQ